MLHIRPEQLERLTESCFENTLVEHVQEFFPDSCAGLGPRELYALVRELAARARAHGLEEGPHICLFLDLAMLFGRDFDTVAWAQEILGDASLAARRDVQMLRLKHAAFERLDAVEARV